jgi:hypothetical protein
MISPTFWTLENITRLFGIGEAVAVMATAGFGFITIDAWRKENLGKRRLELAEATLLAFYDLKQRVIDVRKPLGDPAALDAVAAFEANRSHYYNRMGWLGDMTGEGDPLLNLRPSFQVYFGFESASAFKHMFDAVAPVRGALREIFTSVPANNNTLMSGTELLQILGWDGHARPDHTDRAVDKAVAEIEAICNPVLQGRR